MMDRKILWCCNLTILAITIFIAIAVILMARKETVLKKPEFDVTTVSLNDLDISIEPYRFYLVQNQWGYGLIQFKDEGLDKNLDKVLCRYSSGPFGLDDLTTLPDRTFEPNSAWELRFEKVLQEYEKKLKLQHAYQRPRK